MAGGVQHQQLARLDRLDGEPAPGLRPAVRNEVAATKVLQLREEALSARSVGRDLAVVGFDDVPMAEYIQPPLSSVRQPIREAGHKCVELLIALLEGKAPAQRQVLLKPELIVRASA
jgi:DNA-binding LacI/PurR family transcriptional regulator